MWVCSIMAALNHKLFRQRTRGATPIRQCLKFFDDVVEMMRGKYSSKVVLKYTIDRMPSYELARFHVYTQEEFFLTLRGAGLGLSENKLALPAWAEVVALLRALGHGRRHHRRE